MRMPRWLRQLFGRTCRVCDTPYDSDLCPRCNKFRVHRQQVVHKAPARGPASERATGTWPIRRAE